jgi:hypothetical protein
VQSRLLTAAAALIVLSACNVGNSTQNGMSSILSGGGASTETAKLSAYTGAYNKMLDTFGLVKIAKSYEEDHIATRSASDFVSVNDGWLDQDLDAINKALAMPGDLGVLDQQAKTLRDAITTVSKHLKNLKIYYDSKAYKDDNLARGKREDPQMLAEFKAALKAMDEFNVTLSAKRRTSEDALMTKLKASGNMLAYNNKLALRQSEDLIDLFKSPEDVSNSAIIAKADAQVATIEKTLTDLRASIDAAKAKGGDPSTNASLTEYGMVADNLTRMTGAYRDLKRSKSSSDYDSVISAYNSAIEESNDIND